MGVENGYSLSGCDSDSDLVRRSPVMVYVMGHDLRVPGWFSDSDFHKLISDCERRMLGFVDWGEFLARSLEDFQNYEIMNRDRLLEAENVVRTLISMGFQLGAAGDALYLADCVTNKLYIDSVLAECDLAGNDLEAGLENYDVMVAAVCDMMKRGVLIREGYYNPDSLIGKIGMRKALSLPPSFESQESSSGDIPPAFSDFVNGL